MNVYSVLTEFKFEAAEALATSDALQNKLRGVAGAAEAVNEGMQSAAKSLLAQIGFYGGIGGAIYSAIKAADHFEKTQRSLANIFLSNGMFAGANSFENSMIASEKALDNMKKTAREFSLPVNDLVGAAKGIAAVLVNKGLDDSSLGTSTKLARGFLKSAPVLGIDPGLAQNQLINMVTGHASMNDTLAQRLMNETSAMKPYQAATSGAGGHSAGGGMGKFNALNEAKRVQVLTDSLMQFGSNAKIVSENAKSLSSQMQRLTDNLTGMFSILKPIGKAILEPLKELFMKLNVFLETTGEASIKKLGDMLHDVFANPEKLYADIQQLRHLSKDVKTGGTLLAEYSIIHGITIALRYLGFELKGGLIATGLRYLLTGLQTLGSWFVTIGGLGYIWIALKYVIMDVIWPLTLLTTILQGISRGWALAKLENLKWVADNMVAITELFSDLKMALERFYAPFSLAIEGIAEMTKHLFSHNIAWGFLLSSMIRLAELLKFIGDIIVFVLSAISGAVQVMMNTIYDILSGNFSKMKELPQDFMAGFDIIWDRYHKKSSVNIDTSATSQQVVNIDTVTIQNAFKEQMEPDRIAFALKDQLMRAAANPTQASGMSLSGKGIRNN